MFIASLAPLGALYIMMRYQRLHRPPFQYSLSPMSTCHNRSLKSFQHHLCNSGQLTQLMQFTKFSCLQNKMLVAFHEFWRSTFWGAEEIRICFDPNTSWEQNLKKKIIFNSIYCKHAFAGCKETGFGIWHIKTALWSSPHAVLGPNSKFILSAAAFLH